MIVFGNAAQSFGGLQGYSGYGRGFAGGGRTIFANYSFGEAWSSDDFESNTQFNNWVKPYLDQVQGAAGMTWDPPSSSLKTNAATALDQWNQAAMAGDQTASNYVAQIDQQMHDLINRADQLSLNQSLGHRSEGTEVERYQTFQSIVNLMKTLVGSAPPKPAPHIADVSPAAQIAVQQMQIQKFTPAAGGVTVLGKGTGAATAGGGTVGTVQPMGGGGYSPPQVAPIAAPPSGPSWMTIGLIGGGVVVAGAVLLLLFKKKPASTGVAGYRRRRRSLRR